MKLFEQVSANDLICVRVCICQTILTSHLRSWRYWVCNAIFAPEVAGCCGSPRYIVLPADCGAVMCADGDSGHTTVHTHLENQPCEERSVADCTTGGSKFDSGVVGRGGRTLGISRPPIQYRGFLPWG